MNTTTATVNLNSTTLVQARARKRQLEQQLKKLKQSTASPWSDDDDEKAEAYEVIGQAQSLYAQLQQLKYDIGSAARKSS